MKKSQKPQPKNPTTPPVTSNQTPGPSEAEAELTADIKRIQAEFINYKNRVEAEKATLSQFAKADVIKDLLPVIDDLERALNHLPEELKNNKWAQGTSKVYDRLQKQLEKLGVTKIDALNKPFDPMYHEAVQVEGDGNHQLVSEVLQSGYMLSDLVVRHAVVKVQQS